MKKVLALLLALACALPLGVAAAAASGDAIPYPNIGLVVESDLCDGDGAVYSAADVIGAAVLAFLLYQVVYSIRRTKNTSHEQIRQKA